MSLTVGAAYCCPNLQINFNLMKENLRPLLLLIACFLALAAPSALAQTKPVEAVAAKTTGAPIEKKIVFSLKEQKESEYTCVFTKGVNYQLNLNVAEIAATKLSLKIFDAQRKELTSKITNLKSEPIPILYFNCPTTGLYFLKVTPL